jgi:hypothetical protein
MSRMHDQRKYNKVEKWADGLMYAFVVNVIMVVCGFIVGVPLEIAVRKMVGSDGGAAVSIAVSGVFAIAAGTSYASYSIVRVVQEWKAMSARTGTKNRRASKAQIVVYLFAGGVAMIAGCGFFINAVRAFL